MSSILSVYDSPLNKCSLVHVYRYKMPEGVSDSDRGGHFEVTSERKLKWQPSSVYCLLVDHTFMYDSFLYCVLLCVVCMIA